jgi:hypothetical protein
MKLRIDLLVKNRKKITEICLHQLQTHKTVDFDIRIYNDHSTELTSDWLSQYGEVYTYPDFPAYTNQTEHRRSNRINYLRGKQFLDFLDTDYTHLYMVDNDALHTPNYANILEMCANFNFPATLYRSSFMTKKIRVNKKVKDLSNIIELRSGLCGGISVLFSRAHVEKIVKKMGPKGWPSMPRMKPDWDTKIWHILGQRFVMPTQSHVDHFAVGGRNHGKWTSDEGVELTPYLQRLRQPIRMYLEDKIARDVVFTKLQKNI